MSRSFIKAAIVLALLSGVGVLYYAYSLYKLDSHNVTKRTSEVKKSTFSGVHKHKNKKKLRKTYHE